jgi:type IV secretory pathway VirB2 component (pilin)
MASLVAVVLAALIGLSALFGLMDPRVASELTSIERPR